MSSAHPEPASFVPRHLGPSDAEVRAMLDALGYPTLDAFIDAIDRASILETVRTGASGIARGERILKA